MINDELNNATFKKFFTYEMAFYMLLISISLGLSAQNVSIDISKVDMQGHRGARGLVPENTVPAFLRALVEGVTTLEMDVVISKDGQVVVSHEPYMSSSICSKPNGEPVGFEESKNLNLYQMTSEEISQYDCGTKR